MRHHIGMLNGKSYSEKIFRCTGILHIPSVFLFNDPGHQTALPLSGRYSLQRNPGFSIRRRAFSFEDLLNEKKLAADEHIKSFRSSERVAATRK
ncbi:MAG: hypothetical protein FDX18_06940 [Chlorobium sp.]|nr:MAG: hypothetical protein FDX18_06940 [Chlorobium sp.]